MPTPAPRLVIFDCDGVLIDSEIIAARAQSRALAEHGIAITPQEAARRFAGIPDADMWQTLQDENARALPADFPRQYADRLQDTFRQELRALPGVRETLAALRQRGMAYCVASSSTPPKLEAALKLVGLWEEFAPNVFSTAQVAHGKPAPDVFLFAARQMRTAILECVVVEDSVPGVRAARAARMRAVGYIGASHNGPDQRKRLLDEGAFEVIDDLRRLSEII
ncbi:phosphoglycolate phosphatase [Achromobacter xylosoxidans]|jgi:HAD superfamily hydrolase (TIGR01509 family)|uniref:6-phosphogluconate phosphatase n=2 Tax=Achromobacter TaxID=222 RepID=A0A1D8IA33_9BURK|nr:MULTISPECIES: HAD family phosphatase [Achromobacter]AMG46469.1 HAD family phosphatase [Achromobacter xylosoxidans]AOU93312.1 putative phosphatase YieH [Achromobacter ruhlandii]MCI1835921.1 HAD family phosphatase [Achromobacter ruhlandii]MCV6798940.1 HAD family phosphatase [Achromobacter ruhlandii]MCV6806356.1 HAD family phosphatase [Achromobacter ruhlandii]